MEKKDTLQKYLDEHGIILEEGEFIDDGEDVVLQISLFGKQDDEQ